MQVPEAHWIAPVLTTHCCPATSLHVLCAQVSPLALAQSAASSQASLNWPRAWQVVEVPLERHTKDAAQSLFWVQVSFCWPTGPHLPFARHACSHLMSGPQGLPSGTRQVPVKLDPEALTHLASPRQSSMLSQVVLAATHADTRMFCATQVPAHWLLAVQALPAAHTQALVTQLAMVAAPPDALGQEVLAQSVESSQLPPRTTVVMVQVPPTQKFTHSLLLLQL